MVRLSHLRNHRTYLKVSGWSFLLLAVFYFVFSMSQPILSDQNPMYFENFVHYLQSLTEIQKAFLGLLTLIPLLFFSAAMGCYSALRPYAPILSGFMLLSFIFSAIGYITSLARWHLVNLMVADVWDTALGAEQEGLMTFALFLDKYMGDVFGIYIAEGFLALGFALLGLAMLKSKRFPKWLVSWISFSALWLSISLLRVPFPSVKPLYEWGEMLLVMPLSFIALGLSMFYFRGAREKRLADYHPKFQKESLKKNSKKAKKRPHSKKGKRGRDFDAE